MKHELGRTIMTEFRRLRSKTYSYLISDENEDILYILKKLTRLHLVVMMTKC